jgi:hypothetical protein
LNLIYLVPYPHSYPSHKLPLHQQRQRSIKTALCFWQLCVCVCASGWRFHDIRTKDRIRLWSWLLLLVAPADASHEKHRAIGACGGSGDTSSLATPARCNLDLRLEAGASFLVALVIEIEIKSQSYLGAFSIEIGRCAACGIQVGEMQPTREPVSPINLRPSMTICEQSRITSKTDWATSTSERGGERERFGSFCRKPSRMPIKHE